MSSIDWYTSRIALLALLTLYLSPLTVVYLPDLSKLKSFCSIVFSPVSSKASLKEPIFAPEPSISKEAHFSNWAVSLSSFNFPIPLITFTVCTNWGIFKLPAAIDFNAAPKKFLGWAAKE